MTPRQLIVLNINDRVLMEQDDYKGFYEIRNAQSVVAVQEFLRAGTASVDLFLVDVDMHDNKHLAGLEWGDATFRLYGPLLALPFLEPKGLSAFVPYSNFWGYPTVTRNGFVLVSVSLLLSHVHGRPFSLSDVQDFIHESVGATKRDAGDLSEGDEGSAPISLEADADKEDNDNLAQEAGLALEQSVRQLRNRIEQDQSIQFVDVGATITRLQELEDAANERMEWPLQVPLRDMEGPLSVDLCRPPHTAESFQLASIFGDVLKFDGPRESNDLSLIYKILERWKKRSVERSGDLYESVRAALEECERGVRLDEAASGTKFATTVGDKYPVMRLAMEFAWVTAWQIEPIAKKRTEVVHRLLGLENRTSEKVKMDRNAGTRYKRFLGVSKAKGASISTDPWRTPFKEAPSGVSDAYKLDENKVGALTVFEKWMCIRYASEVLRWDPLGNPEESPYPVWMV